MSKVKNVRALCCAVLVGTGVLLPAAAAHATYPGQNGLIAFSTDAAQDHGGRSQVFTVRPDGSGLRQLTHVAAPYSARVPDWSPDGRRLLFVTDRTGRSQIWVMAANGGSQRQVLRDPGRDDVDARWAPDGRNIVFARCASAVVPFAYCDIATVRSDGTGLRTLVGGRWANTEPEVSPDGRRIAFASDRGGLLSAIWVVDANGAQLHRLTAPGLEAFYPDWRPDGRRIVFSSGCCKPFSEVYDMAPDGTGVRQLTAVPGPVHGAGFATYSPDGREIVFVSNLRDSTGVHNDLFTMAADGSHLRVVPNTRSYALATDWGPAR